MRPEVSAGGNDMANALTGGGRMDYSHRHDDVPNSRTRRALEPLRLLRGTLWRPRPAYDSPGPGASVGSDRFSGPAGTEWTRRTGPSDFHDN